MPVWSLGSPYGKISITEDFAPHLDLFKRGLELADILNAKHIRLFSFYVPAGEASAYRNAVMERLFAFLDTAAGSGILLCHERWRFCRKVSRATRQKALPHQAAAGFPAPFRPVRSGYQRGMGTALPLCGIHAYQGRASGRLCCPGRKRDRQYPVPSF